jgi:hypothetical protein
MRLQASTCFLVLLRARVTLLPQGGSLSSRLVPAGLDYIGGLQIGPHIGRDAGAAVRPRGHDQGSGTSRSPSDLNYLTLSSSSVQGLTFRPRAIRAILSIETLRSERSTPLR